MEARYPVFATADIAVESRDVPHDVMVEEIIKVLGDYPFPAQPAV
jgi:hypothetical protein